MHTQLEELWMDAIETKVGEQIATYLRKSHPEYQDIGKRQKKLIENYPILQKVLDGEGAVTLDEKEHRALKEYWTNQDDMERLEKEYHYYYGQSHVFSYGRILKSIQREINPDGAVARNKRRRKTALEQEAILKAMNLPKDVMNQIDLLTCSINDYWSRYSDLIYQYAIEDILAFLIER